MSEPGREALLEHVGFLRNLAKGLVACEADAEDVVQETLLTAIRKPPAPGNLRGWLSRVARNVALMRHRSRQRAARRELLATRGDALPSPVEIAARLELERRVVDAVAELDEPYRSTLILHFYDGMSPSEIARHLGIPSATVRVRLKRGLEKLRARLEVKSEDRRALMLGLLLLAKEPRRFPLWAAAAAVLAVTGGVVYDRATDEPRPVRAATVAATEPETPSPAPPPLHVRGRVVDSYGRPRMGFPVELCEAPPRGRFNEKDPRPVAQALTDALGAYSLAIPAGRSLVRAGEEEVILEEPCALDFRVAGEPARGRVTEGGMPVAGAVVRSRFGRVVTDQDGGFALDPPLSIDGRVFAGPPYEIARTEPFALVVPEGATVAILAEFPDGTATAIVTAEGRAPRKVHARRGDKVALEPGRKIEGVVLCEGAPVAGAEVTWLGGFDAVMEVARTGKDGRFVLMNVPSSAVALTATHEEFLPKGLDYATFILGGAGGTMDEEIEMVRAVERRGRVAPAAAGVRVAARPKGLPWSADVRRALERAGLDWTAVTAEDGSFTIRQLPPDVPLVVSAESLEGTAEAEAFELRLEPWPTTDGEVVDEHGTPVGGARIRGARVRGYSGPDGRFRLFGAALGELVVSHPEFAGVIVRDPARIVLPRGEVVRGIVDAPGALVIAGPRSTYADAKGAFEIRGLEPGEYRVFFHAAGRVARAVDAAAPGPPLDLVLERAGRLLGRVTSRGAPVAGARVHAISEDWAFDHATTDADGRFVLERVPERAPFALRIVAGADVRIENVTSGTREIELP